MDKQITHHEYTSRCPHCGALHSAVTNASLSEKTPPKPGDLFICVDCGNVSCVGDDRRPARLSDAELKEVLRMHPEIEVAQKHFRMGH